MTFLFSVGAVQAQTTAFTYQGKLTEAGNPANGNYDLQFKLFDMVTVGTGTQQGATLVRNPVAASAGVFTVTLDFGANVFGGADRYLEIGVRPAGSATPYTILAPRQPVTASPYAIQTLNAQQLAGLPANRYVATNASGNVGIGTTTPTSKLDIAAQDGLAITGFQPFMTLRDTNAGGARSILAGGNGDFGFYTSNSLISGSPAVIVRNSTGNVGIGVSNPTARLEVSAGNSAGILANSQGNAIIGYSSAPGYAAVYGQNISNSTGYGVYGKGTSGYAMYAEGNAGQSRDKGGWVKAMVYVEGAGVLLRCYNGLTGSSSANCGFTVSRIFDSGSYYINFEFQVSDRFWSATVDGDCCNEVNSIHVGSFSLNVLQVYVYRQDGDLVDKPFMLIVY